MCYKINSKWTCHSFLFHFQETHVYRLLNMNFNPCQANKRCSFKVLLLHKERIEATTVSQSNGLILTKFGLLQIFCNNSINYRRIIVMQLCKSSIRCLKSVSTNPSAIRASCQRRSFGANVCKWQITQPVPTSSALKTRFSC